MGTLLLRPRTLSLKTSWLRISYNKKNKYTLNSLPYFIGRGDTNAFVQFWFFSEKCISR